MDEEEEDDGLKPLSDRLVMELTAHRTLALRNALAQDPQVAFLAALRLFYRYGVDSCVEIEPRNAAFGAQVPGLCDTACAQAIEQHHETWARNLTKTPEDLREARTEFGGCRREALFAHCVAICAGPELIIADEPTTALDVAVQAQIMDLLARICDEHGTSMMLVTHDRGVSTASQPPAICGAWLKGRSPIARILSTDEVAHFRTTPWQDFPSPLPYAWTRPRQP